MSEPVRKTLAQRSMTGVLWTYSGTVARVAAQIVVTAILARLMGPLPFGITGMAMAVIGLATLVAEQGMGAALVQRVDLTEAQIRIVYTRLLLAGTLAALTCMAVAPAVALFYREPLLERPMQVLSLTLIPATLYSVSGALLRRQMRVRAIQAAHFASYIAGYGGVALPLAWLGMGIWSLVFGSVVQNAVVTGLCYALAPHPLRPAFGGGTAGLSRYGWTAAGSNIAVWITEALPQVAAGRTFGAAPLGLFNAAYNVVRTPATLAGGGGIDMLFMASARAGSGGDFRRRSLIVSTSLIALVMAPAFVSAAAVGRTLMLALYGPHWEAAAQLVVPFALAMPLVVLSGASSAVLVSSGFARRDVRIQVFSLVLLGAAVAIAASHSLGAVAWAAAAALALRGLLTLRAALAVVGLGWSELLRAVRAGALAAPAIAALLWLLDAALRAAAVHAVPALALDAVAGAVLLALAVLALRGLLPTETRWSLAQLIGRIPLRLAARAARHFD